MCSREDRSQAHDAGEVTVGYLVIMYNYITAITYRCLVMELGRNIPPSQDMWEDQGHAFQMEVFWANEYILMLIIKHLILCQEDFYPKRKTTCRVR